MLNATVVEPVAIAIIQALYFKLRVAGTILDYAIVMHWHGG